MRGTEEKQNQINILKQDVKVLEAVKNTYHVVKKELQSTMSIHMKDSREYQETGKYCL